MPKLILWRGEKSDSRSVGILKRVEVNKEEIKDQLQSVFSDYALNGQGKRILVDDLAEAIMKYMEAKCQ